MSRRTVPSVKLLNEVLSLNAQELACLQIAQAKNVLLNEVLSLNAQESPYAPYNHGVSCPQ